MLYLPLKSKVFHLPLISILYQNILHLAIIKNIFDLQYFISIPLNLLLEYPFQLLLIILLIFFHLLSLFNIEAIF
jgi:hypothetical protein